MNAFQLKSSLQPAATNSPTVTGRVSDIKAACNRVLKPEPHPWRGRAIPRRNDGGASK